MTAQRAPPKAGLTSLAPGARAILLRAGFRWNYDSQNVVVCLDPTDAPAQKYVGMMRSFALADGTELPPLQLIEHGSAHSIPRKDIGAAWYQLLSQALA